VTISISSIWECVLLLLLLVVVVVVVLLLLPLSPAAAHHLVQPLQHVVSIHVSKAILIRNYRRITALI
jgi:hypothetical protein